MQHQTRPAPTREALTRTVHPKGLDLDFEILAADTIIGPAIERGSWEDHESALFRAHLRPGARVAAATASRSTMRRYRAVSSAACR